MYLSCASTGEEQKMPYQTITATDAAGILETEKPVIIDVRDPGEFSSGHIRDAVNISLRDPGFMAKVEALDRKAVYLVYCLSGHRSRQAVTIMDSLGFQKVYTISGGLQSWTAEGLPLVT
jgi:rhodanese-related sulfurtransferase